MYNFDDTISEHAKISDLIAQYFEQLFQYNGIELCLLARKEQILKQDHHLTDSLIVKHELDQISMNVDLIRSQKNSMRRAIEKLEIAMAK